VPSSSSATSKGPVAFRAEGVGKRYRLGELTRRGRYRPGLLSERLTEATRAPFQWLSGKRRDSSADEDEEFWALRDISFEMHRGEALGLIGRNGAGKSTLLKLISRITLPTEGRIVTYGRVSTLLEVGTGFHPELTGRENIYLRGTVLGMRRREIDRKFEEIVDFSGVERFLETPVKHYSSGMYVRLAFAVAAHLEPEIVLVDEVLAVGDFEFQKKCLGKMEDIAGEGRAVVFVSHNLNAVQRLCDRALLLEGGRLVADGTAGEVAGAYLEAIQPEQEGGTSVISERVDRKGIGGARLSRLKMTDLAGRPTGRLYLGQPFRIEATYQVEEEMEAVVEFGISNMDGQRIATVQNIDGGGEPFQLAPGTRAVSAEIEITMLPGDYAIDAILLRTDQKVPDSVERALRFSALNVPHEGGSSWPWRRVRGHVQPASTWSEPAPESLVAEPREPTAAERQG
jgi:lipopolysaccharide transport system ATP-binding protein